MKKFVSDCNECTEQKKSSVCRECHVYWMGKLDEAVDSRASAIGKLGAYKTNFLKAQAGEKKVIADLIQLQHEKNNADAIIFADGKLIDSKVIEIRELNQTLTASKAACVITMRKFHEETDKKHTLLNSLHFIKALCETGNKFFVRKKTLDEVWIKADDGFAEVTE